MRKSCTSAQFSIKNISFIIREVFVVVPRRCRSRFVCLWILWTSLYGTLNGELFQNRLPARQSPVKCTDRTPMGNCAQMCPTLCPQSLRTVLYRHNKSLFAHSARFEFSTMDLLAFAECLRTVQLST